MFVAETIFLVPLGMKSTFFPGAVEYIGPRMMKQKETEREHRGSLFRGTLIMNLGVKKTFSAASAPLNPLHDGLPGYVRYVGKRLFRGWYTATYMSKSVPKACSDYYTYIRTRTGSCWQTRYCMEVETKASAV